MIRGLWSATGGMMARELKQDVIAHNLANVSTSGFKRRMVAFRTSPQSFDAVLNQAVSAQNVPSAAVSVPYTDEYRDLHHGPIQHTGNDFNVAIEGDGYFVVEDRGTTSLTRNGSFAIDSDGELSTSAGEKVMGTRGAIRVPDGKFEIDREGNVMVDGQVVDTLRLAQSDGARIRQGELEMSNVNVVTEMVDMISNTRAYEANQKVVHAIDQTLDKLVNDAGR